MTDEQLKDLWQAFHRFQKSREKKYAPKINTALKSQVNQFITAKRNGASDMQALDKVTAFDLWVTLKPLYLDAGINYGAKTLTYIKRQKARMPIGFNELMIQLIENYFEIELLNNVEDITQTTRDLIRNIMIEAYPLGLSFDEIVKQMEVPGFTAKRARLIARTETVTASNTGGMLAAKTTGLNMNKVWISAQDNRTRRVPRDKFDHLHMNGVTIAAEDKFNVTGELMEFPGDRKSGAGAGNICNCRCTHGYIPLRENGRLVRV